MDALGKKGIPQTGILDDVLYLKAQMENSSHKLWTFSFVESRVFERCLFLWLLCCFEVRQEQIGDDKNNITYNKDL